MDELLLFTIVFSAVIFIGIMFSAWYRYLTEKEKVQDYLVDVADMPMQTTNVIKKSLLQRVLERLLVYADDFSDIGERFNFFSESDDVSRWLIHANHPLNLTVKRFQGFKIVLFIIGLIAGIITVIIDFPFSYLLVVILPIVGFFYPIIWIRNKAKKRQAELSYALPDFLDMVSVNLKAGASLDQALNQISSYFEGPIKDEFARFNQRLQLGIPREEAYRELIDRTDVPEFEMVIKALIRGAQLGVPVSKTFETQSMEIRRLRKEKVKELAAKAAPKVTMITTFIVMPTAFILIGGLVLLNVFSDIKSGFF